MKYYECGICDHIHPWDWYGDCRGDANRLTLDDIPQDAELLSWEERCEADCMRWPA
jgi:hypothetical protein